MASTVEAMTRPMRSAVALRALVSLQGGHCYSWSTGLQAGEVRYSRRRGA